MEETGHSALGFRGDREGKWGSRFHFNMSFSLSDGFLHGHKAQGRKQGPVKAREHNGRPGVGTSKDCFCFSPSGNCEIRELAEQGTGVHE